MANFTENELGIGNVLPVRPIAPRTNNLVDIKSEAVTMEILSSGDLTPVRIFTTPTPAPHIPPSITSKDFHHAMRSVYGDGASLSPRYDRTTLFPPQLITWIDQDSTLADTNGILGLPDVLRNDAQAMLAKQIKSAHAFCSVAANNTPGSEVYFWGTWGRYPDGKRLQDGLNRGGPTLANKHIHVTAMPPSTSMEGHIQRLPYTELETINHTRALERAFMGIFGPHIQKSLTDLSRATVIKDEFSFTIECPKVKSIEQVLDELGGIAVSMDRLYQLNRQLHKSIWSRDEDTDGVMEMMAKEYQLGPRDQANLRVLHHHLHPTLRQVRGEGYGIPGNRRTVYDSRRAHETLPIHELMLDQGLAVGTVHGCSSCAYGAQLNKNADVTRYILYPLIQSTEAFVEPYYRPDGLVIRRPTQ